MIDLKASYMNSHATISCKY